MALVTAPATHVNGFPKTGTHALQKAVGLLGQKCTHTHQPHPHAFDGRHICAFRHPRNALISWLRWNNQPPVTGPILLTLDAPFAEGDTFVEHYRRYLPWRGDGNTLCVSFEELIATDAVIKSIADYLGVPYLDDAFDALYGSSITWSGRLSDWSEHWNDTIQAKWVECGGQALQEEIGYG